MNALSCAHIFNATSSLKANFVRFGHNLKTFIAFNYGFASKAPDAKWLKR